MGLAFLVVGCATLKPVSKPVVVADSPGSIKAWSMDGRIGVQASERAWQANLYWEHDPAQDRLRISGPLSQGLVSIVVQKDLIFVNEGNGVTSLSRDPDSMLRQRLGFSVPLSSLRYWIMGIPDPGSPSNRAHTDDRGDDFEQADWLVSTDEMVKVAGWMLPRKLRVQGAGVKLKILADSWELKD